MSSSYRWLKIMRRKRNASILAENNFKTAPVYSKSSAPSRFTDISCRVCLKDADRPIFSDNGQDNISEDICLYGDVTIKKDDGYPQYICNACYVLLQGAIMFRKSAKETERLLESKKVSVDNCLSFEDDINHDVLSDNPEFQDDGCNDLTAVNKPHNCKLCKKNFHTSDEYAKHRSSKEHKNVRIQCSICNRLLTAQLYRRHLMRHQTASHLICEVCGKLYRKDNLVRHLQLHSFDLPFQCQMCPYRGRFMESLRIHMRTHTGDKPFSCESCQLRFLTRSNLNRHLLTHRKDRPFKCIECNRGFYTKCDLDIHLKADHAGIKDFGCSLCGNKYGTRKALMRHELRVHKRDKLAKGRVPLYLQNEYRKQDDTVHS